MYRSKHSPPKNIRERIDYDTQWVYSFFALGIRSHMGITGVDSMYLGSSELQRPADTLNVHISNDKGRIGYLRNLDGVE